MRVFKALWACQLQAAGWRLWSRVFVGRQEKRAGPSWDAQAGDRVLPCSLAGNSASNILSVVAASLRHHSGVPPSVTLPSRLLHLHGNEKLMKCMIEFRPKQGRFRPSSFLGAALSWRAY